MSKKNTFDDKKTSDKNTINSKENAKINYIVQKENKLYSNIYNPNKLDNKEINKDLTEIQNKNKSVKNHDSNIILKNLKQKQNTLINDLDSLKRKKNTMNEISYNNISQAKIDNNLYNNKIKGIKNIENDLVNKLSETKRQINELSSSKNYTPNKKQKSLEQNINLNNKFSGKINKVQLLEENNMRLMELQNEYKNKQKELKELEEKKKNEKLKYLMEHREKEMEIIRKRKKIIDEKMAKLKSQSEPAPNKKDCLFYKMEQNFQENEKKLLNKISTEKKIKNIYYRQNVDMENINKEFQSFKNQLHQRSIEQTNNMKKVWHSRSMITKQYQTNTMIGLKENEEAQAKNEKIMKLTKRGLLLEKELYARKKVKLPAINEKLKKESNKNQIDIKNLEGKERIKYVNDRYMQKGFRIKNINKDFDYGKKYVFNKKGKKKKLPGIISSNEMENKKIGNSFSSENIMNNKNLRANKIKRNPKEINYLEEFKKDKKQNFHNWKKFIINKDTNKEIDIEGIQNINKQIEVLDEKTNMGNELIKIKGGYEKNIEYGEQLNNMLIDSLKGKLAIIEEKI